MSAKMPPHHASVLLALNEITQPSGECCVYFRTIARKVEMEVQQVRRITRHLARKGLAEYWRGLWTEDGDLAGAGYCITDKGREIANAL